MKQIKQLAAFVLPLILLAACNEHGSKVTQGHIEVYYKKGITKEQAEKTAKAIYDVDVQNGGTAETKSMQLEKPGDTVIFRMVVQKERLAGVPDESFHAIGNIVSAALGGIPVNVELTDNKFNGFKTLTFKKMNFDEEGTEMPTDDKP
jgi:hypothetical protein